MFVLGLLQLGKQLELCARTARVMCSIRSSYVLEPRASYVPELLELCAAFCCIKGVDANE